MEDHSVFPLKVIGIINSMIRPLLSALISLDDFAQEYFEELDIYGQIKEIQDQVQCVAQDFFELRTLTLLSADGKLRAEKRGRRASSSGSKGGPIASICLFYYLVATGIM